MDLINFGQTVITFLNKNSGAIQTLSTVVLVAVTIWYARSTKRMADLMKDQITPRIIIENISIGSQFAEEWFATRGAPTKSNFYSIETLFDVRNEGNATGSVYKPSLTLSLESIEFSKRLEPLTKSHELKAISTGQGTITQSNTTYHGGSIILNGGTSEKVELSYYFYVENDEDIRFIKAVQLDPTAVQYYLITKDSYGNEYKYHVSDIKEERGFGLR